jgi:hypothetical protein
LCVGSLAFPVTHPESLSSVPECLGQSLHITERLVVFVMNESCRRLAAVAYNSISGILDARPESGLDSQYVVVQGRKEGYMMRCG